MVLVVVLVVVPGNAWANYRTGKCLFSIKWLKNTPPICCCFSLLSGSGDGSAGGSACGSSNGSAGGSGDGSVGGSRQCMGKLRNWKLFISYVVGQKDSIHCCCFSLLSGSGDGSAGGSGDGSASGSGEGSAGGSGSGSVGGSRQCMGKLQNWKLFIPYKVGQKPSIQLLLLLQASQSHCRTSCGPPVASLAHPWSGTFPPDESLFVRE